MIPWDEVSAEDGTGLVHIAPGCGFEDFDLGRRHGLPVVAPVDPEGRYLRRLRLPLGHRGRSTPAPRSPAS